MKKLLFIILIVTVASCTYDKSEEEPVISNGYPENISNILVNKCATSGCHNTASRNSCAGLDFTTWDLMFEGGRNGTSVISYSTDNSFMLYSVNTDTLKGPVLLPTMPYQEAPLSDAEYQTLVDWIAAGAPNKENFVKFSDNSIRKKVYVCIQGCDLVAVVDAESKVIMRYIKVGIDPIPIEGPHQVKVSPDGQYWYSVFIAGSVLQKFRTSDDQLVASINIGFGNWNTIIITPDGKTGFVNDPNVSAGKSVIVNLETMTPKNTLGFDSPHGGFVTTDGQFLYLTAQTGNFVTKLNLVTDTIFYNDNVRISLVTGQQPSVASSLDPHEAMLSPDGSKYFVSCQKSNEVRVMQTSNDSLLAVIPVGTKPQEFDVSLTHPYLFVTCTEDPVSSNQKGRVYVIDYNTLQIITTIYTGYQPHGLAVDDDEDIVYVANLNYDPNAPAPHHVSSCSGRNGNMTIIDMNTLQLWNKTQSDGVQYQYKNELLPFPYFVSLRK